MKSRGASNQNTNNNNKGRNEHEHKQNPTENMSDDKANKTKKMEKRRRRRRTDRRRFPFLETFVARQKKASEEMDVRGKCAAKLRVLSGSQSSIETVSLWLMHHSTHAKECVEAWSDALKAGMACL